MMPLNKTKVVAGGVCLFAAGGASGYFVAKKRLETVYKTIADEEIESVRETYQKQQKLEKEGVYADPLSAAEALGLEVEVPEEDPQLARGRALIENLGYRTDAFTDGDEVEGEVVVDDIEGNGTVVNVGVINIFDQAVTDGDEALRWDPSDHEGSIEPYEVPVSYFMANEAEDEIICLRYYEEDDVLCDDRDQAVEDKEATVGLENLEAFGRMSQDENIVYIRNERIKAIIEVTRETGRYAHIVLGIPLEVLDVDAEKRRPRVNRRGERQD